MSEPINLPSASVRHGLPFLHPAQAQKEAFVNEALARLDALTHCNVAGVLSDPPPSPSIGDSYIVDAAATGDWSGAENSIATWQGTHWLLVPPVAGTVALRLDLGQITVFNNQWVLPAPPSEPVGGTTIDQEARSAIGELVNTLQQLQILPQS